MIPALRNIKKIFTNKGEINAKSSLKHYSSARLTLLSTVRMKYVCI